MNHRVRLVHGDALDVLRGLPDASVDALVTDPPAGISFMGRNWDHDRGGRAGWVAVFAAMFAECLRILKPGAHGFVWALPRTAHWTATALEDVGFEIRDCVTHLFATGFPKSLDVSKAIDKAAGARRARMRVPADVVRNPKAIKSGHGVDGGDRPWMREAIARGYHEQDGPEPASAAARQWHGWGTALKPAAEFWLLVRKPLGGRTVAGNVLAHGTGALNVDRCRTETKPSAPGVVNPGSASTGTGASLIGSSRSRQIEYAANLPDGRWPANLLLSHADGCGAECVPSCPVMALDAQSGERPGMAISPLHRGSTTGRGLGYSSSSPHQVAQVEYSDTGGAARFFPTFGPDEPPFRYVPKAARGEREEGLDEAHEQGARTPMAGRGQGGLKCVGCGRWKVSGNPCACAVPDFQPTTFDRPEVANHHPTVKPVALMRWLCRLITPPGGTVLDPFMGSGTTGVACAAEGFAFLGIEREADYLALAEARIADATRQGRLLFDTAPAEGVAG